MKKLSLNQKLFIFMTTIILLFTLSLLFFIEIYLKRTLEIESINNSKALVTTISKHITDYLLIKDLIAVNNYFEEIMNANTEVAYIFIVQNGEILIHTFRNGFPKKLLDLGHNKNILDYTKIRDNNNVYYDFSIPIFEGRAGILRLGFHERTGEKALKSIIKTMGLLTLLIIGLIFTVSIIISKKLTQPLTILTSSAIEIAEGNYAKKVDIPATNGDDEVGRLAIAFNKMVDAVRIREKELRDINEELEIVNVTLHEYIEKLKKTQDELIKSKQDAAVVETSRAFLHHIRQPLTYLIMAIDLLKEDAHDVKTLDVNSCIQKLNAIEDAGMRFAELLKKFENLYEYKTVGYDSHTKIIDIGE